MAERTTAVATQAAAPPSLVAKFAAKFGVEPNKMVSTLKATAFRTSGNTEISNEQMMALLIVADQHGLNPWTKEIFAFPDKNNGIVPVVGVDGWSRIINEHSQFDGVEFKYGPPGEKHKQAPEWIECTIYRKDRAHPTRIRERLVECIRDTGPWGTHPGRMLRHKALIQCARAAFGFAGIYDEDEAQRIVERDITPTGDSAISELNARIAGKKTKPAAQTIDAPTSGDSLPEAPQMISESRPPLELDGNAPPALTYAEVRAALETAKTDEAKALALDMIRSVADEKQRDELTEIARLLELA